MNIGKIIEIRGVVVDVQFKQGETPNVYEALTVQIAKDTTLVLEVQSIMDDGRVRTVAMGSTQGLSLIHI